MGAVEGNKVTDRWELGFKLGFISNGPDLDKTGLVFGVNAVVNPSSVPEIETELAASSIGSFTVFEDCPDETGEDCNILGFSNEVSYYIQFSSAMNPTIDDDFIRGHVKLSLGPLIQFEDTSVLSRLRDELPIETNLNRWWIGAKTGLRYTIPDNRRSNILHLVSLTVYFSANHLFDTENGNFIEQIDMGAIYRW